MLLAVGPCQSEVRNEQQLNRLVIGHPGSELTLYVSRSVHCVDNFLNDIFIFHRAPLFAANIVSDQIACNLRLFMQDVRKRAVHPYPILPLPFL